MVERFGYSKVDSQRRIYIPREVPFEAEKAIIMPYGASFLLIPVPGKVIEIEVKASIRELKKRAEEKAKREVMIRLKTRGQI